MDLQELDAEEIQVFADLVVQMVLADNEISDEERAELAELGHEFGDAFRKAAEGAETKTRAEALEGARGVVRQTTRDLILTMLYDMAATDGLDEAEEDFLAQVREMWTFSW